MKYRHKLTIFLVVTSLVPMTVLAWYSHSRLSTMVRSSELEDMQSIMEQTRESIDIDHLTERNYQNRTIGLIENGSWAPTAAKVMKGMFEKSKNITWTENNVKVMSAVKEENVKEIEALAEELCK